jgi:hypothetical protein
VSSKSATCILVAAAEAGFSILVLFFGFALAELQPAKENTVAKSAEIKRFDFIILVLIG